MTDKMPDDAEVKEAVEEFDRFCRFIDGMNMGGLVENDFMSKKIQAKIRAVLNASRQPEKIDRKALLERLRREIVRLDFDTPEAAVLDYLSTFPNGLIVSEFE